MDTNLLTMAITLLIATALVALPLLRLRSARTALQGLGGSLCLAAGCGTIFAMCSGFLGDVSMTGVFAADSGANETAKNPPAAQPATDASPATTAEAKGKLEKQLPEGELHTPPKVAPEGPVIPPGRPEWVGKNIMVGSEHSIAVCSGPWATEAEADRELDKIIKAATDEYIAEQLGSTLAPQLIRYDAPTIKRELIRQNIFHEQISVSIGPMQQAHALIEFGPEFRNHLQRRWTDLTANWRLAQTGLIACGALLFLGTIFSYFRLDNATRGYYTGRLQFLAAAAILAIVGSGAVLARWWIYWL